jgi:hypothetical protein
VRGSVRIPSHVAPSFPHEPRTPSSDDDRFIGRSCYVFNPQLLKSLDDTHCSHCRFYLTARCPHIDEFLDDVDDLSPE